VRKRLSLEVRDSPLGERKKRKMRRRLAGIGLTGDSRPIIKKEGSKYWGGDAGEFR